MVIDLELPWGREEIIEAMAAEYLPFDLDDSHYVAVTLANVTGRCCAWPPAVEGH